MKKFIACFAVLTALYSLVVKGQTYTTTTTITVTKNAVYQFKVTGGSGTGKLNGKVFDCGISNSGFGMWGGTGATLTANFLLLAGDVVYVIPGSAAQYDCAPIGGGGGASAVVVNRGGSYHLLMVGGGGGGGGSTQNGFGGTITNYNTTQTAAGGAGNLNGGGGGGGVGTGLNGSAGQLSTGGSPGIVNNHVTAAAGSSSSGSNGGAGFGAGGGGGVADATPSTPGGGGGGGGYIGGNGGAANQGGGGGSSFINTSELGYTALQIISATAGIDGGNTAYSGGNGSVVVTVAPRPVITSFSPASGPAGTSVTITGTNFNSSMTGNTVYFGAVKGTVTAASTNGTSLTVTVPVGATYEYLSVINTESTLAGFSAKPFKATYTIGAGTRFFEPPVNMTTGAGPNAVAVGDLDGDGKPDLAVPNGNSTVSVFRNTSASGTVAFTAKMDLNTGDAENKALIKDLDGDGKSDLIVLSVGNLISVFRNISSPGSIVFQSRQDFGSFGANNMAIGDIDGDGKPEIVASVASAVNIIYVLWNSSHSGTINFLPGVDFSAGTSPVSVAIGDIDGDGKPEVVSSNFQSDNISVFLNTSTPGTVNFASRVNFTTGSSPQYVALADIDGDDKLDIEVANTLSNTVSVFRNIAVSGSITSGSLDSKIDFATGAAPVGINIGDLDGDGKPDLAVNLNSQNISVLYNTASNGSIVAGSFSANTDVITTAGSTFGAIADIDGDTKPDLTFANSTANAVSVMRNGLKSAPTVTNVAASGIFPTGASLNAIVNDNNAATAVSFEYGTAANLAGATSIAATTGASITAKAGNTNSSVLITGLTASTTYYYRATAVNSEGTTAGTPILSFITSAEPPTILSFSPQSGPVGTTVTINGTNYNTTAGNNTVYFGAAKAQVLSATATQLKVIVPSGADFQNISETNTGTNLTAYSARPFKVTFNSIGSLTLAAAVDLATGTGSKPYTIISKDLDGDGKPDLITTSYLPAGNVSVFRNTSSQGTFSFAAKQDIASGNSIGSVTVADIDGDGKPDIISSNQGTSTISVMLNTSATGTISFAAQVDFATSNSPFFLTSGDLDGDGKPDIAVTSNFGRVSVFRNESTPGVVTLSPKTDFIAGNNPQSIVLADFDSDGKMDMIASNIGSSTISIFKGISVKGAISFATATEIPVASGPQTITTGDADNDGKPDLFISNLTAGSLSVIRNVSTSGTIAFSGKVDFTGVPNIAYQGSGDLDGDGKIDVVGSSFLSAGMITIFKNVSSGGSIDINYFQKTSLTAGNGNYFVNIGDLDGDNKPDIAFASSGSSKLILLRNTIQTANANLSALALSSGTLTPAFANTTTDYTASVSNAVSSVTVTPTAELTTSTIKVNNMPVISGSASGSIPLIAGNNILTVVVTDMDSVTTKTYTVNVTRAKGDQAITFASTASKIYGAADYLPGAVATSGLDVSYSSGNTAVATIVAGKIHIVAAGNATITAAQTGNASFNAAPSVSQILTVTKAPLTITPDNKTRGFGEANPALTVSYTGFVNSETSSVLTTPPALTTTANTGSAPGTYSIIASGAAAANYTITYVDGTLTIGGPPTDIVLTAGVLYENQAAGTQAGMLSSISSDAGSTFTYSLVSGTGSTDNASFIINGDKLLTAVPLNYENKASYNILVRSANQYGFFIDKQLSLTINDVNEAPTLAAIANQVLCYTESQQSITLSGITAGPEAGQTITVTAVSGNGTLLGPLTVTGTGANRTISYVPADLNGGTTTITVTVKDNGGTDNGGNDTFTRTFTVTVNPVPAILIHSDLGTDVSKGYTANLTASGGTIYSWSTGSGIISGQNSATLTVRPDKTTTYTVTATNSSGCSSTESITIRILEDYKALEINNVLSPNGDGKNDGLVIKNLDMYPGNTVRIFDKAGKELYVKKNYTNDWTGTFQGSPLAEDTYYYIVDFGPGKGLLKGFVSIIR